MAMVIFVTRNLMGLTKKNEEQQKLLDIRTENTT